MVTLRQINLGINGFGSLSKRIIKEIQNRNVLKHPIIKVQCVNDPVFNCDFMKFVYNFNSIEKKAKHIVKFNALVHDNLEDIKWSDYDIDYVIDTTPDNINNSDMKTHIKNGAKYVITTNPSINIPLFIYGRNHNSLTNETVISSSFSGNECINFIIQIIESQFGIKYLNITNAYLNADKLLNKITNKNHADNELNKNYSTIELSFKTIETVTYEDIIKSFRDYSLYTVEQDIYIYNDDYNLQPIYINNNTYKYIIYIQKDLSIHNNGFKLIAWYNTEDGHIDNIMNMILYINKKNNYKLNNYTNINNIMNTN
jgi:glyceraldehyde-3-phosphate dehydrogenase/erythrose-4-phosphate dehydrogenase